MYFKELKPNYIVHILCKGDELKYTQGKVVSVSAPRFQPADMKTGYQNFGNTVVDVTISTDEGTNTYTMMDNITITYTTDKVLSTDKEGIVKELQSIKNTCEEVLNSVEANKKKLATCNTLLSELDTDFKIKKENDERMSKLENNIESLNHTLHQILQKLNN